MKLTLAEFPAPLRTPVKHASATRKTTENVICLIEADGVVGVGEGCPRQYVTGESPASARLWLAEHGPKIVARALAAGLDGLAHWANDNRQLIDHAPAAFCAIELAVLDLLARRAAEPIEALLGRPRLSGCFHYTAVLGDSSPLVFKALLTRYLVRGLRDVKIKLSGDLARDRAKLRWLRHPRLRVRADANNLWTKPDECIDHLRSIGADLFAVEEPLTAGDVQGFAEIAGALDTRIVLDESALRGAQLRALPGEPEQWILNCRVSKMGGLSRSLEAVSDAKAAHIGVIVGAQVGETSILTRAALTVAASAGPWLLAQEGAFGTNLLEFDLVEPPLMFGRRGRLDVDDGVLDSDAAGLGLVIDRRRLRQIEDLPPGEHD